MKKKFGIIGIISAAVLSFSFVLGACGGSNGANKKYTIQYTDDYGVHTLQVEDGGVYTLETIPYRYGYQFTGLYSMEKGGIQYVNSSGASVSPFQDGMNVVLFPQFEANKYTLILEYGEAAVTGSRSFEVAYDSFMPTLPTNLQAQYKTFTGWYTQPDCKGVQIADQYGVRPEMNKFNENNFNLDNSQGNVYLYAGFKGVEYDVVLNFDNGQTEEIKVEHGTNVSNIIYDTRVGGQGVIVWSTQENDTDKSDAFSGKITGAVQLYAVEYAPVLELDENGGDEVASVVARAGATISLPIPVKENYRFVEWQDINGNTYNSSVMPSSSMQLKAVWQAKLVFDENGGTEVTDISVAAGSNITLPVCERDGYVFAGWYTSDKVKYETASMPATSIKLKAGWYKAKKQTIVKISSTEVIYMSLTAPKTNDVYDGLSSELLDGKWAAGLTFDFSKSFGVSNTYVTIDFHLKAKRIDNSSSLNQDKMHFNFYSAKAISSSVSLDERIIDIDNGVYNDYTFKVTLPVSDMAMVCWYCNQGTSGYSNNACIKDLYYTIHYPDMTSLYL